MKPVSYYHARKAKKLYALVNAMARVNKAEWLKDFAGLANMLAVAIEVEANQTVMQVVGRMKRKLKAIDPGEVLERAFVNDTRLFLDAVARDVKYAEA